MTHTTRSIESIYEELRVAVRNSPWPNFITWYVYEYWARSYLEGELTPQGKAHELEGDLEHAYKDMWSQVDPYLCIFWDKMVAQHPELIFSESEGGAGE